MIECLDYHESGNSQWKLMQQDRVNVNIVALGRIKLQQQQQSIRNEWMNDSVGTANDEAGECTPDNEEKDR